MSHENIGAIETGESFLWHGRKLLIFQGNVRNLLIFQGFSGKWDKYMCSLLEVHTLGPTSTKYMPWAMRFTCQAVAVTGVLAYDVGGRCAHFQRGTAKTGSFGAKIKIHRKITQNADCRAHLAPGGRRASP